MRYKTSWDWTRDSQIINETFLMFYLHQNTNQGQENQRVNNNRRNKNRLVWKHVLFVEHG